MGSFKAMLLLMKVARISEQQQFSFSKQEIVSKINEIKYLSSQKKVPKLTLRKEILHLENKLTGVLNLEKKVLKKRKEESAKVTSLKRQITYLKHQLAACEDKTLNQRVDKLTHLLGDSLAHIDTSNNIRLTEQVQDEFEGKKKCNLALFQTIVQRLTVLKEDLQTQAEQENNPEKIKAIKLKMYNLSKKLVEYQDKHPECKIQGIEMEETVTPEQVQHEIVFHESVTGSKQADLTEENQELEKELPLPPPPRMK